VRPGRAHLASFFEHRNEDVRRLLAERPDWSDERIAKRAWGNGPCVGWVRTQRHLNAGTIPVLRTHPEIVRWGYEVASLLGWIAEPEHSVPVGDRNRLIPDLVVRDSATDEVVILVEVKTALATPSSVDQAVRQVARYHDYFAVRQSGDFVSCVLAPYFPTSGPTALVTTTGVRLWEPEDFAKAAAS
jgi:hypothetical protein